MHEIRHGRSVCFEVNKVGTFFYEQASPGEGKVFCFYHIATESREGNCEHSVRVLYDRAVVCAFELYRMSFKVFSVFNAEDFFALLEREELAVVLVAVTNYFFAEEVCDVCLNGRYTHRYPIVVCVRRDWVARHHSAFVVVSLERPVRQMVEARNASAEMRICCVHRLPRDGVLACDGPVVAGSVHP